MLKSTIRNVQAQSAYKPTAKDYLQLLALVAIFIFAAMLEGGAIL